MKTLFPLYRVDDEVEIYRLDDEITSKILIGKRGIICEIDSLPNGQFNYVVLSRDGRHYMHEGELRKLEQ